MQLGVFNPQEAAPWFSQAGMDALQQRAKLLAVLALGDAAAEGGQRASAEDAAQPRKEGHPGVADVSSPERV